MPVSGLWRRLIFSYYYRDVNLLVTENILPGSRIMFRRNIANHIRTAPFCGHGSDPPGRATTVNSIGLYTYPSVTISVFTEQYARHQLHPEFGQGGRKCVYRRHRFLRRRC